MVVKVNRPERGQGGEPCHGKDVHEERWGYGKESREQVPEQVPVLVLVVETTTRSVGVSVGAN